MSEGILARRKISDWYPDRRFPKNLDPKIQRIDNPNSVAERQNLNWLIYSRGPYSGTENVDVWKNYSMNAYVASNNTFFKSNPVEGLDIQARILEKYAKAQEESTRARFGVSSQELIDNYGIAQKLFEEEDNLINELNKLRDEITQHTNSQNIGTASAVQAYKTALQQEKDGVKELQVLQQEFQKFSKLLQKVQDYGAKMDATAGEAALKNLEMGREEFVEATAKQANFDVARSLKIDKTGYTSAVNLIKIGQQLEKDTAAIDASTGKFPKKFTRLKKIQAKNTKAGGYVERTRQRSWDSVTNYTVNMITNYFGSAFEVASAITLQQAFEEIFSGVKLLGAEKGVTVKTPNGVNLSESTSKTDVKAILKNGIELNFSNKHQSHSAPGPTKVQDGNLFNLLSTVLDAPEARETLYAGMMNDRFWSATSSMNQFVTSLIIDRAVGGIMGNRIDFMLYKDAIIPLETYIRNIQQAYMTIAAGEFRKFTKNPDPNNKTIPASTKGATIKVLVK